MTAIATCKLVLCTETRHRLLGPTDYRRLVITVASSLQCGTVVTRRSEFRVSEKHKFMCMVNEQADTTKAHNH